ncbi:hypothetical protein J3D52_004316 [Achromobacter insolitus]|nr:hypothetical protein [Achromobacter insolitus]
MRKHWPDASGGASSLRMLGFFSRRGCPAPFRCSPRRGCASYGSGVLGWQSPNALVLSPRLWAGVASRWPGGGVRSAAPMGRASESRSPAAGGSRTLRHKTQVRVAGLRARGCQGSLAAEAALRHSDARPGGAALRMAPGSSAGSRLMHRFSAPVYGQVSRAGGQAEGSEAQPQWGEHRNPAVRTPAAQEPCFPKSKCGWQGFEPADARVL